MPTFQPTPDLTMHYEVDDFTDPWRQPETVLLLHGNAESGAAWYGWVPYPCASLPHRAARHARLWRLDGDAARFSVDPRPADRGLHRPAGPARLPPLPSGRRTARRNI